MNRRLLWVSSVWEQMSSFCGLHQMRCWCCIIVNPIRSVHVKTCMLGLNRQIWRSLCALHYDISVLLRETHEHSGGRQIWVSSFCTILYFSLHIFRHWSLEWHEESTTASTGYLLHGLAFLYLNITVLLLANTVVVVSLPVQLAQMWSIRQKELYVSSLYEQSTAYLGKQSVCRDPKTITERTDNKHCPTGWISVNLHWKMYLA